MQRHNWEHTRIHAHYSPTVNYSLGPAYENFHGVERKNLNLQLNNLLYRRNTKLSQANLYLLSQAGIAFNDDTTDPNLTSTLSGDWETRRFFTSYMLQGRYADSFDSGSLHQVARVGIAPYIADYGSLHTWLMLQAEHHPHEEDSEYEFVITPLLRFFKGDYLAEFGINSESDAILNFVIRF